MSAKVVASEDLIRIATGDWIPYIHNGKVDKGPLAQLVIDIYAKHGIDVQFIFVPWVDGYAGVITGEYDATLPYYPSAERFANTLASNPLFQSEVVFFHRTEDDISWQKIGDLADKVIGISKGYFYGMPFHKEVDAGRLNTIGLVREEASVMALLRGRLDLYPQDRKVGYAFIDKVMPKEGRKSIRHNEKVLFRANLYILFSKASAQSLRFKEIFDKELSNVKRAGKYPELFQ